MLTFRSAAVEDIPLVRALAERIWRVSYAQMISLAQMDYMLAWMYSAETIAAEIAGGMLWEIAVLEGVPCGYLALTLTGDGPAELHKLYLLPECQGRGLGQAMLARAVEQAAVRSCAELRLRVNRRNFRALRAYERGGFRIVDELVADIGGGYVMDDYVLSRSVPQRG